IARDPTRSTVQLATDRRANFGGVSTGRRTVSHSERLGRCRPLKKTPECPWSASVTEYSRSRGGRSILRGGFLLIFIFPQPHKTRATQMGVGVHSTNSNCPTNRGRSHLQSFIFSAVRPWSPPAALFLRQIHEWALGTLQAAEPFEQLLVGGWREA